MLFATITTVLPVVTKCLTPPSGGAISEADWEEALSVCPYGQPPLPKGEARFFAVLPMGEARFFTALPEGGVFQKNGYSLRKGEEMPDHLSPSL